MRAAVVSTIVLTCLVAVSGTSVLAALDTNVRMSPVTLKIGQSVVVGELTLTLLAVSDSRCPRSVDCFWEGMAGAVLRASTPNGEAIEREIFTHARFGTEFTFARYTIAMAGVAPFPATPDPIDPSQYVVSLDVTAQQSVVAVEEATWGRIKSLFTTD